MRDLKIGDSSANGNVVVVDEDRLCYLVRNTSKGAQGLRTISKALLGEFVDYISKNPDKSANDAREALCGLTDIDKFEYGYASTLVNMAKMVIEGVPNETDKSINYKKKQSQDARQIIYYGAPGTGKSHKIKVMLDSVPCENIFRTTFHPDSDYSTFVGAYKPTMKKYCRYDGKVKAKYYEDDDLVGAKKDEIIIDKVIEYDFVPQAFIKAYMCAYQTEENVYLVIEEINRGNCAQIFGDLFQLLDRDENGVSEYKIKADADIVNYLEEKLGKDSAGIKDGELCLPSNLYIYATMNTSDQSLFPIDSAFKRRWDWEYKPIKYKNTDWVIKIAGNKYSWASFQKKVNEKIFEDTNSEDKMLGDYFVKANSENVISERLFVNKVLFYLWNDVCKDGDNDIFKTDDNKDVKFSDLYGDKETEILLGMMNNLGVELLVEEEEYEDDEDDSNSPNEKSKRRNKYTINNGTEQYTTPQTVKYVIEDYAKSHKDISVEEMLTTWNRISQRNNCLREFWEPSPNDNQKFADRRYIPIEWDNKIVWLINGWTEELFKIFIHNVKEEFGIEIKKIDAPIH